MCNNCDKHDFINNFDVPDISAVMLLLVNTLVESYIKDQYCDPMLYKALITTRDLAVRFSELTEEYSEDEELKVGAREIVEKIELTLIEAGETINKIIEDNDLPVMKNTFEFDITHPKAKKKMRKMGRGK